MRSLLAGFLLEFLVIIAYIITKNKKIFLYGTEFIAFGSIIIGIIISGLLSDNIYRRTAVENKAERFIRLKRTFNLILLGIPSIIILIIYSIINITS